MNGKGPVIISLREGVGEVGGFFGVLHGFIWERRGGGGSSNEKGDYRELTASEWGINRMLQSLIGGSGRFYHDSNKILSPPPPPQAINNKRSLTGP